MEHLSITSAPIEALNSAHHSLSVTAQFFSETKHINPVLSDLKRAPLRLFPVRPPLPQASQVIRPLCPALLAQCLSLPAPTHTSFGTPLCLKVDLTGADRLNGPKKKSTKINLSVLATAPSISVATVSAAAAVVAVKKAVAALAAVVA